MRYWGGPYDGTDVSPYERGKPSLRLPVLPYVNDAGGTVFAAVGSFEGYQWVKERQRYEWRGTFAAGPGVT